MRILAFETSCDETAVAVVRDGRWIESNLIASQVELHRPFGGIVPEAASRAHLTNIVPLLEDTLAALERDGRTIDAVAVTRGPGLAGALLVGVNVAKAVAYARHLPLLGLNHLEGHVYANWLVGGQRIRVDVALQVVEAEQRQVAGIGHGFGDVDADEQRCG